MILPPAPFIVFFSPPPCQTINHAYQINEFIMIEPVEPAIETFFPLKWKSNNEEKLINAGLKRNS